MGTRAVTTPTTTPSTMISFLRMSKVADLEIEGKGVEIKLGSEVAEGVPMADREEGWRVGVGEGVRDVVEEGEAVRV